MKNILRWAVAFSMLAVTILWVTNGVNRHFFFGYLVAGGLFIMFTDPKMKA